MSTTTSTGVKQAAISWSAGKDSCLALLRAREQGLRVAHFLTLCDADGKSKSHAIAPELIDAQVRALGGQPWRVNVADGVPGEYARCFDQSLHALREAGCSHMVFGDIDLQAHRDWLVPRCEAAGLTPVFVLWGEPRAALAREVLRRGIRARIVCVDTALLDARFCGRDYDAQFLAELPPGVCPCGEDGEFHTFVHDAPGMATPLAIESAGTETVASVPPFRPTQFVFDRLRLRAS